MRIVLCVMTILTMNRKELEKRVGKIDAKLEKAITDMGTPSGCSPQVVGCRSLTLVGGGLSVALCGARGGEC